MNPIPIIAIPLLSLLCSLSIRAESEPIFLREDSQDAKAREGILLYIDSKGGLVTDGGPKTEKALRETFKLWRDQRTEPHIRLILYPSLKSNSDLKAVRRIVDLLRSSKVGYDIMLQPIDAKPEKDLIQD